MANTFDSATAWTSWTMLLGPRTRTQAVCHRGLSGRSRRAPLCARTFDCSGGPTPPRRETCRDLRAAVVVRHRAGPIATDSRAVPSCVDISFHRLTPFTGQFLRIAGTRLTPDNHSIVDGQMDWTSSNASRCFFPGFESSRCSICPTLFRRECSRETR